MLVQNKGKYVRHAAGVMIVPGGNEITDAEWKKIIGNKIMKTLVDKGEIEAKKNLKDLNADDAIDLVKDTFSLSLLEEMKAGEKRKTVLDAIEDQTAEIQGENEQE